MKKAIIALVAMIIAAGGSVGAYVAVKHNKDKEKQQVKDQLADNVLFSFDPYSPTQIEFSNKNEKYTAQTDGETWTLSSGEFPVDQDYCKLICVYLSDLKAETNYGPITDEKLKMYGLDDPDTISVTAPSGTHTINIGDLSPMGDYYYATVEGKENIYAIESMKGSVLRIDRLLLKNKMLVPYSAHDIKELTITKEGKTVCHLSYDKDADKWSLPEEYDMLGTDNTRVSAVISTFVRLEADEMLDENLTDLSKYGFDKPYAEIDVKGIDNSERHITIAVNEDEPTYCLALMDDGQVERYYRSDLDIVDKEPFNYIIKNKIVAAYQDTNKFSVKFNGNEDTCELDLANSKCVYNGKKADIASVEIYSAFNNFFNSISILEYSGTDINAAPRLKDPVLSAEFETKEDGTKKLDLVKGDDGRCYVFLDGKYNGGYVDETVLTGRNSISEFYIKFKKLADL